MEEMEGELAGLPPLKTQIAVSPGVPERKAVGRRQARVQHMLHELSPSAQQAIRDSLRREPAKDTTTLYR
jgi:phospholipid/cholesterol/gamma-HCH transport system ATP-binding protein